MVTALKGSTTLRTASQRFSFGVIGFTCGPLVKRSYQLISGFGGHGRRNGLSAWLGVGARRRIAGAGNCPRCDCRGFGAGTGAGSGLAGPSSRGAGVGRGLRLRGFRQPQRGLGALTLPGPHRPDGQKERRQEQCQVGKPCPPHPVEVAGGSASVVI